MTTYYPLIGGLMLGSCVYHQLYYNGSVLGISGIYRSSLSAISAKFRNKLLDGNRPSISDRDDIDEEPRKQSGGDTSANDNSKGEQNWKIAFTAGLLVGGALLRVFGPQIENKLGISIFDPVSVRFLSKYPLTTFLAGMLVGVGTKMAGGCTSGHMLCGISRLSSRSITATATFFATAVAVVHLLQPTTPQPSASYLTPKFDLTTILLLQLPLLLYRYIIPNTIPKPWYKIVSSFFIAIHFSFGLAIAGMLQASKIQNFLALPFSSSFDPSLALVAVGGLLPNLITWITYIRNTEKPVYSDKFDIPKKKVDRKLILGSILFGIGWGGLGICPGPGLVLSTALAKGWQAIGIWVIGFSLGGFVSPVN